MNEIKYRGLSVAVDTGIKLKEPTHLFRFRGYTLKYTVSQRASFTDTISICYPSKQCSHDQAYKVITEFLSLWSFDQDVPVIPGRCFIAGTLFPTEESAIAGCAIVQSEARVPKSILDDTIHYLPKIETDIQDKTVRLYRQARSCINVYSQILFFWHTLVYPETNDKNAQEFIQTFINQKMEGYNHIFEDIELLLENKDGALSKEVCCSNIGKYIRENVRHAIAHIVRSRGQSLELDNLDQQAHLKIISRILHYIARYKIEKQHNLSLQEPHGLDYFMTLPNPSEK